MSCKNKLNNTEQLEKMDFRTWRTEIYKTLRNYGVKENEAVSIANSSRGMYYDEYKYVTPNDIIAPILDRRMYGLMSEKGVDQWKKDKKTFLHKTR